MNRADAIRLTATTAAAGVLAELCCTVNAIARPDTGYTSGTGLAAGALIYLGIHAVKWSERHQRRR